MNDTINTSIINCTLYVKKKIRLIDNDISAERSIRLNITPDIIKYIIITPL
ncbi:hypothetical protein [Nanobdella aerobiophila]|uniref:hypothetical protein n=1 Tax=Nanobdella aerobiophila TaxID=2586965 RepID=UPI0021AC097B|nr:hypothetical protein [Nanobdella aerobiophila]